MPRRNGPDAQSPKHPDRIANARTLTADEVVVLDSAVRVLCGINFQDHPRKEQQLILNAIRGLVQIAARVTGKDKAVK
jgi:hypothetical protein